MNTTDCKSKIENLLDIHNNTRERDPSSIIEKEDYRSNKKGQRGIPKSKKVDHQDCTDFKKFTRRIFLYDP